MEQNEDLASSKEMAIAINGPFYGIEELIHPGGKHEYRVYVAKDKYHVFKMSQLCTSRGFKRSYYRLTGLEIPHIDGDTWARLMSNCLNDAITIEVIK